MTVIYTGKTSTEANADLDAIVASVAAESGARAAALLTAEAYALGLIAIPAITGEVGVLNVLYPVGDVRRYRAPLDVSVDWYTAIQNAITSCEAQTVFLPPVRLQSQRYYVSKPLRITKTGMRFAGPGSRYASAQILGIPGTFQFGPLMVVAPSVASGYTGLPTAGALLSGPGSAMTFDGSNSCLLSLRHDCTTVELNGLTAFTAETTIKNPGASFASDSVFVSSMGRRLRSEAVTSGFVLGAFSGGTPYGKITVAGVLKTVIGSVGSLTVGVAHHLAMTWDGATVRLFLNGVQVASTAAAGTLTQALTEDVTVGPSFQDWPEATLLIGTQAGLILDGVRISNIARYTAGFTKPIAKAASDANTLVLLNFDNQFDIFTVGKTKDGDAYFPVRRSDLVSVTGCPYVEIEAINFETQAGNSGLYVWYCQQGIFERVRITGAGPTGLFLGYNSYECSLSYLEIELSGSNNIGLCMNVAAGVTNLLHPIFVGAAVQLVSVSSSTTMEFPFFAQSSATVYNAILKGAGGRDSHALISPAIDSEVGGAFIAALLLSELSVFSSIGGEYEMFSTEAVWIDDNGRDGVYEFRGGSMLFQNAAPASAFKIITAPVRPIKVSMGQSGVGVPIPWANVVGAVEVQQSGFKAVTFSATPIFDAFYYGTFAITLTGNVTSSTLPNGTAGQIVTFLITQDATGGRTFAWPTSVKGAGAVLSTAGKVTSQSFRFDGTSWRALGALIDVT